MRKAGDVASGNQDVFFCYSQYLGAVFGDLVALLCRHEIGGVEFLEPDIGFLDTRPPALAMEFESLVAHRVHLDHKAEVDLLDFAQVNQAIKNDFPVLVSSEIIVRDEKNR